MNGDGSVFMNGKVTQQGSHMIMTNVYKPTRKKYINIDSRFHDGYQSTRELGLSSFSYTLPNIVFDVKSIRVTNIELPTCFYNFSTYNKNAFFTTMSGEINENESYRREDVSLCVLDEGFYNVNLVMASLNELGKIFDLSFECVEKSFKTKITNHAANNKRTVFWGVSETGNEDRYFLQSRLGWALGFRNSEYVIDFGSSNTITSEALIDLMPFKYLFLAVDDYLKSNPGSFTSPMFDSHINKSVLARMSTVPNTFTYHKPRTFSVPAGNLVSDKREYVGKSNLQRMKLEIVNEYGRLIELHHMPVSFCLEIEYE